MRVFVVTYSSSLIVSLSLLFVNNMILTGWITLMFIYSSDVIIDIYYIIHYTSRCQSEEPEQGDTHAEPIYVPDP